TYRQNTELMVEAWHWNPSGTWSDPQHQQCYFVGNAEPTGEMIRHSWAAPLPHRGFSRGDGNGWSRLTDGDLNSYWKSNPYLTKTFTGEDDSMHPQWVMIDLGSKIDVNAIRIAWAEPYAKKYSVQFWTGELEPCTATTQLDQSRGDQVGFDFFMTSGITRGLQTMVPIAMLYATPEDAANEIAYLYKRHYPISYVEMGEEADGQHMLPEDYGALYLQFAAAIHRLVPEAKLGGPCFEGTREDVEVWPDVAA